jgi:hypothetical protein
MENDIDENSNVELNNLYNNNLNQFNDDSINNEDDEDIENEEYDNDIDEAAVAAADDDDNNNNNNNNNINDENDKNNQVELYLQQKKMNKKTIKRKHSELNETKITSLNDFDYKTYLLRTMNEILTSQLTLTRKVDHIKDNFNMINKRIKGTYIKKYFFRIPTFFELI